MPAIADEATTVEPVAVFSTKQKVFEDLFLSWAHSPYWLLLAVFSGANMLQASFTGFCPMVMVLKKFGIKPGQAFD